MPWLSRGIVPVPVASAYAPACLTSTKWRGTNGSMKAAIILSTLAVLAGPVRAQERIDYAIRGTSATELIGQMRSLGPNSFWAWTQARYDWRYQYRQSAGLCHIASVDVTETITVTLPRWANREAGKSCLRTEWDNMLARLTEHEMGHVSRWSGTRERIRAALLATPPASSCEATGKAAKEAGNAEIRRTQMLQDAYDRQTNHGLATGVRLHEC